MTKKTVKKKRPKKPPAGSKTTSPPPEVKIAHSIKKEKLEPRTGKQAASPWTNTVAVSGTSYGSNITSPPEEKKVNSVSDEELDRLRKKAALSWRKPVPNSGPHEQAPYLTYLVNYCDNKTCTSEGETLPRAEGERFIEEGPIKYTQTYDIDGTAMTGKRGPYRLFRPCWHCKQETTVFDKENSAGSIEFSGVFCLRCKKGLYCKVKLIDWGTGERVNNIREIPSCRNCSKKPSATP